MKSIDEILNNYKEYETFLDDRFGRRFCEFLTIAEMKKVGFSIKEYNTDSWKPKDWTYQNVLLQLKDDAEFGLEKAEDEKALSSTLMYEVCKSWCKIIGKENLIEEYHDYGVGTFKNIIEFIEDEIKATNKSLQYSKVKIGEDSMSKAFVIKNKEGKYLDDYNCETNSLNFAKVYNNPFIVSENMEKEGWKPQLITIAEGNLEKETRKQVCDEIRQYCKEHFEPVKNELGYIASLDRDDFYNFLDKIEGAE